MDSFGLNFILFVEYITSIQATQTTITIQSLYKWDSEESQMTYLNLYPKSLHY